MALRCVAALSLLAVAAGRFQGFRRGNVLHDPPQGAESEELWFTQRLDHFNGADSRVWKQVSVEQSEGCQVSLLPEVFTPWNKLVQQRVWMKGSKTSNNFTK